MNTMLPAPVSHNPWLPTSINRHASLLSTTRSSAAMASTSAPPNHDAMMLLEAPLARVPHDELRRHLRTQQRFVERDLTFCTSTLDALSKSARAASSSTGRNAIAGVAATPANASGSATPQLPSTYSSGTVSRGEAAEDQADASAVDASLLADVSFASDFNGDESLLGSLAAQGGAGGEDDNVSADVLSLLNSKKGTELERSLDVIIGRVKGLKRKLASVHESTGSTLTRLEARTNHLDDLHRIQNTGSSSFDEWCRTRLDRMLVDWMLRKGFPRSAELLAKNRRIEKYVDLSLFAEIVRIESSLLGRSGNLNLPEAGHLTSSTSLRSCGPTLAWCSENKAALRKIRSTLEFDLRLQEFVELARARTPQSLQDAITHSRRYLLPYLAAAPSSTNAAKSSGADADKAKADEKEEQQDREQQEMIRMQVARAMGLLACGPSGWAYTDLYDAARWQSLCDKFRAAALEIHSLPPQPLLHIALSAGLSSLKLPACYADQPWRTTAPPAHLGGRAFGDERSNLLSVSGITSTTSVSAPPLFPPAAGVPPSLVLSPPTTTSGEGALGNVGEQENGSGDGSRTTACLHSKNDNCPVCDVHGLGILAREVPWSHHANSTLVCTISGRIMDENDPPMALPNGRVYSLAALQELASNSMDKATVVCPRTGTSFPITSLRKVYIS